MALRAGGSAPNITAFHFRESAALVSGQCGAPHWPGTTRLSRGVRGSCGARPLRPPASLLHNAALPLSSPPVAALKLRLVPVTASRPSGEGNRRYAKWPSLESVAQPSALPGRWHALRAAVCAPLWLSWHRGIGQALRAVCLVSGLRPVMWCVPPPTLVLRRCAASALRAGLPVRPPWGLPQPARLLGWVLLQV